MKIPKPVGGLSRRRLLKLGAAAVTAAHGLVGLPGLLADDPATAGTAATSESLAGIFHASLTPSQREAICFPWDYV
ncbi:MAG: hypothetical protein WCJ21_06385, partial [Planctomycetota bacterium]